MFKQIGIICIFTLTVSIAHAAGGDYPDISGLWKNSDGEAMMINQDGKKVSYDHNNKGFRHHAEGSFADNNTVRMTQRRENIKDGCTTYMKLTLNINEYADEMDVNWEAIDNNCDLKAGTTGMAKSYKQD